jgi:NADH-quinone oxidoreductase subunit N
VNSGYVWLALIMLLNSAISVYFYLKLIVYMFLKEPKNKTQTYVGNSSVALKSVIVVCAFFTFFAIFFIQELLSWINEYIVLSNF